MVEIHFETNKKLTIIDCSDLFPPEPMVKVLEAVETLNSDEAVLMIHRKDPRLLYNKLEERHCGFETKLENDGSVQVLIWKKDNEDQ